MAVSTPRFGIGVSYGALNCLIDTQTLSATFTDYMLSRADDMSDFKVDARNVPPPFNAVQRLANHSSIESRKR